MTPKDKSKESQSENNTDNKKPKPKTEWYTESTFAIRDMIYYPNKYFLLAEDNHIKICSLVPDTKNIIINLGNILPI